MQVLREREEAPLRRSGGAGGERLLHAIGFLQLRWNGAGDFYSSEATGLTGGGEARGRLWQDHFAAPSTTLLCIATCVPCVLARNKDPSLYCAQLLSTSRRCPARPENRGPSYATASWPRIPSSRKSTATSMWRRRRACPMPCTTPASRPSSCRSASVRWRR